MPRLLPLVTLVGAVALTARLNEAAEPAIGELPTGWEVAAGPVAVQIEKGSAQIVKMAITGKTVSAKCGGVGFFDGKARRRLAAPAVGEGRIESGREAGGRDRPRLAMSWSSVPDGLRGRYLVEPHRAVIRWQVIVENPGSQQRWLEVRLGLPIEPKHGWQYWDGRNLPIKIAPGSRILSASAAPVLPDTGCTRAAAHYGLDFPLNCAWTENDGLAVGLEPGAFHSYRAGGAEPGGNHPVDRHAAATFADRLEAAGMSNKKDPRAAGAIGVGPGPDLAGTAAEARRAISVLSSLVHDEETFRGFEFYATALKPSS